MIKKITFLLINLLAYQLINCLYGETFKILGTRPLGMGGAFVAIAEDALAQYWNPAGLGIGRDVDVQIPVNTQVEVTGGMLQYVADSVDTVMDSAERLKTIADSYSKIQKAQKEGSFLSLDQLNAYAKGLSEINTIRKDLTNVLNELNDPKKGFLIDVDAGANIRVRQFAFSVNNFISLSFKPYIDIVNIGLGGGTFSVPFSPILRRVELPAGTEQYEGVDLGKIIIDYNAGYKERTGNDIFDTPSDQTSISASDSLVGVLTNISGELNDQLGIKTDSPELHAIIGNMNVEQAIANALVNAATDPQIAAQLGITALTPEQVKGYTDQINEYWIAVKQLIESIQQTVQDVTGTSYTNNQTGITTRGTSIFEASLGYGMAVPYVQKKSVLKGALRGLYAGANVKYITGYVGYASVRVLDATASSTDSMLDKLKDSYKISNAVGVDLGLLMRKKVYNKKNLKSKTGTVSLGLLCRNINSLKLENPPSAVKAGQTAKYVIKPQLRTGLAVWPFNWWTVASDIDLTKNSTVLTKYYSQLWGVGNEFNLVNKKWLNLALRAGLMKNIAVSSSELVYTAGLGLNLFRIVLDAGAALSSGRVKISEKVPVFDDKIPPAVSAALTLSFDF